VQRLCHGKCRRVRRPTTSTKEVDGNQVSESVATRTAEPRLASPTTRLCWIVGLTSSSGAWDEPCRDTPKGVFAPRSLSNIQLSCQSCSSLLDSSSTCIIYLLTVQRHSCFHPELTQLSCPIPSTLIPRQRFDKYLLLYQRLRHCDLIA
jgi:hypothetical protein